MVRLALFGGVYGNPWAVRALFADAERRRCDRLVCLGDLGGFGARPDEAARLVRDAGLPVVAGNYDQSIAEGAEDCGCGYSDPRDNRYAEIMYAFTRDATSPEIARWMATLPAERREEIEGVDVHMVHGSPLAVNDFLWESLDDDALRARLAPSGADVLVCAHTGIPWIRVIDGSLVVNVGTIGRSANDGHPGGWYAILHVEDGEATAELVAVDFDHEAHAQAIREAGLPDAFAATAATGWWTTCLEVLPPRERPPGRYHCYRESLAAIPESAPAGWASAVDESPGDLPVVSLFGSGAFPARLWIYTNFHCNLACGYCAVASSPRAARRSLGLGRVRDVVDEAVAEGFREIYLTGGEPFLEEDLVDMALYAARMLPTTILTNAMLFRGRRAVGLRRLAGVPNLSLQASLDGASDATHDALRGAGSFRRAVDGIRAARGLGIRVLVSTTAAGQSADELADLRALLEDCGVDGVDHALRPLVARGFSHSGAQVSLDRLIPELTVTADGLHWHPVGADVETSADLLVAADPGMALSEGKRLIVERVLSLRQADGSLPSALACAI